MITGNLFVFPTPKTRLWLVTQHNYIKLVFILWKPVMNMSISLKLSITECKAINIEICKQMNETKTSSYLFIMLASEARSKFETFPHFYAQKYFNLYQKLCDVSNKYLSRIFAPKHHMKFYQYQLKVTSGMCIALQTLSTNRQVVSLMSGKKTKYVFHGNTCNYGFSISIIENELSQKLHLSGYELSTVTNLNSKITRLSNMGNNMPDLLNPASIQPITLEGSILQLDYVFSEIYTHLSSNSKLLTMNISKSDASGISILIKDINRIQHSLHNAIRVMLTTFNLTTTQSIMPCKEIHLNVAKNSINATCPEISLDLVYFNHFTSRTRTNYWKLCKDQQDSFCAPKKDNTYKVNVIMSNNEEKLTFYIDSTILDSRDKKSITYPPNIVFHISALSSRSMSNISNTEQNTHARNCSLEFKTKISSKCFPLKIDDESTYLPLEMSKSVYTLSYKESFWQEALGDLYNGELVYRDVTWLEAAWYCFQKNSFLLSLASEQEELEIITFFVRKKRKFQSLIPITFLGLASEKQVIIYKCPILLVQYIS